ncbi:hypothetical protein GCM10010502_51700 [Kitasatospora aureofaciens]|uniref:Uncharacterized protein n=1 Tax=Kitasatospora aureofaciens TaxID=1894 RepID=A0A8H9I1B5_KITAU|nr:hypothetical protein GCM10010502_51700 [Kitasatospora aureofaciens]
MAGAGLAAASPVRPAQMVGRGEVERMEKQADEAADLRDGQGYQAAAVGSGAPFASSCARMAVRQARAAMDRVMCRYQAW